MKWRQLNDYRGKLEILRSQKPYEILEVGVDASPTQIKAAYRRLVKIYHPDKSDTFMQATSTEVLKIINDAYAKLSGRFNERGDS